jgi:DNA helicase-2/ATP-dependent DNA helicase PcrA
MKEWEIIIGPPGTGKTTYLLNEVQKELDAGVPPDKIAYLAFTKKAAREATSRATEKFGSAKFPFFRTIHSLAFWGLGLSRARVMTDDQYQDFGSKMGIRITGHWDLEDGGAFGYETGDRILFMHNLARVRGVSIRELFDEDDDNLEWREVDWLSRGFTEYKRANFLLDFTDMLVDFSEAEVFPEIEVVFVDEAQDLSRAQWKIIERLAQTARRTVIAGDDDQAIFRWAAADVDFFVALPGKVTTLAKSYRVPSEIQGFAADIIEQVSERRPKEWASRDGDDGKVDYHTTIEDVDFSAGEHLVLARNAYLLQNIEAELRSEGFLYAHGNKSSVRPTILEAIVAWEKLRGDQLISHHEAKRIFDQMATGYALKRGAKAALERSDPNTQYNHSSLTELGLNTKDIWHSALDRISPDERSYLTAALRRGEKITKTPRIRLSTIHGSKGGEADNVTVIPDMARRTHAYSQQFPDDENRVFYVAATRARNTLNIIQPRTRKHFTF